MVFNNTKHASSLMEENRNLNLKVVFRRNVLRQKLVDCTFKVIRTGNMENIVNIVIGNSPIGFKLYVSEGGMQNRCL